MAFGWRAPAPRYKVADQALGRVFLGETPSEPLRARNAFLAGSVAEPAELAPWPEDLRHPSYARSILEAVTARDYELTWTPIRAGRVVFYINARPLRVRGVFVNVSATLQQQVADVLGAMLPTPKMMDAAWLGRSATIEAITRPIASTSAAMVQASAALDEEIAGAGDPAGCILCQKTWALGNSLLQHPGRALNYGDFVLPTRGTSWRGIATEACVSIANPALGRVIQGQGWAHNPLHLDYSQVGWFVRHECLVDGVAGDVRDVLRDHALAKYVSHEGVLTVPELRQPGVPVYHSTQTTTGAEEPKPQFPVFDPPSTREQATVQGLLSLLMLDHNTLQREGDTHESATEIDRATVLEGLEQLAMTASGALRATKPRPDLVGQAGRDTAKITVAAVDAFARSAGPLAKAVAQEMMRAGANATMLTAALAALPGTTPITRPAAPPEAEPSTPGGRSDDGEELAKGPAVDRKRTGASGVVAALGIGSCLLIVAMKKR
jgi:hypothetical protein